MRQTGIAPADHVRLRDLDRPSTLLTPEQWAVACEINGTVSARDLAWRCGLALYDTIERLSELVRMGLCVRCPEPTQGLPDGQDAGVPADPASPPGTGSPARPTRRRRPTRTRRTPATQQADPTGEGNQPGEGIRTTRAPAAQQAGPTGDGNRPVPDGIDPRDEVAFTPLPEETLRRVLEGLRKLS